MTEEEKIFAGRLFSPHSKELRDIKHKAHLCCQRYNQLDEYNDGERQALMRGIMGAIGKGFYFQGPVQFNYGRHTFIGENFFANYNFTVLDDARIYIGDNVMCAPNVSLMAASHPLIAEERNGMYDTNGNRFFAEVAEEIHIGNNVWLGCGVTVVGGVTIGKDTVIGAGSVVIHDIPAGVLAAGNPCRVIRPITEKDSLQQLL